MSFELEDHWVWDFWTADDGQRFHLFFLHAPKSLGDPELRHRNARIGHAVSSDLRTWTMLGEALGPGPAGAVDASATWTGSVIRGDDGLWRMFYTGTVFHEQEAHANTQTIALATSADLYTWTKVDNFALKVDPTWYEELGTSDWVEEAWRDPWVFRDNTNQGWHMLITARSNHGPSDQRGVVAHAWSSDLDHWEVRASLGGPAVFPHLEVLQLTRVDGTPVLLFCGRPSEHASDFPDRTGVWVIEGAEMPGPFPVENAYLLAAEPYYAGRIVHDRDGIPHLMAFRGNGTDGAFAGDITDPMPIRRDAGGRLVLASSPRNAVWPTAADASI